MEGDCVLDLCIERDSYDSGHSKTNEVFSVLLMADLNAANEMSCSFCGSIDNTYLLRYVLSMVPACQV